MHDVLKPAHDILEELEMHIKTINKPADMQTHMQNARLIREALNELQTWAVVAKNKIFLKSR